jgi:D-tyrosyl-tRNA(Tyr) deacylase
MASSVLLARTGKLFIDNCSLLIETMRLVIQRVREASVTVEGAITGQIGPGLLVLVGCAPTDDEAALTWMVRKLVNLRIFSDENGQMDRSVRDVSGKVLVVSQFTLLADARKGNRPSYVGAAPPAVAEPLYQRFVALVAQELGQPVPTGIFGADMQVRLLNDGPVTIVLDSPVATA